MKKRVMSNFKSRKIILIMLLFIISLFTFLYSDSKAYLASQTMGDEEVIVSMSSCSSIGMSSDFDSITLTNAYPVSDNIGLQSEDYYEFSIHNECEEIDYITVYMVINDKSSINASDVKMHYNEQTKLLSDYKLVEFKEDYLTQYDMLTSNTAAEIYVLGAYEVYGLETRNLSFKLWLDSESVDTENKFFSSTIIVANGNLVESN